MKRRDFIIKTSLSSCLLPAVALNACQTREDLSDQPDEQTFILEEITIQSLQRMMSEGELTARSVLEMYLQRIELLDKNGPRLNSVIELNPDALAIAKQMDEERKNGKIRGPLHGIPYLLKDNIDTGDRMMTTAGSLALAGHYAAQDAPVVKQLRNAGAVLMGKTNLSEWANFRSTRSSSGWSSRGGQTKNPYVLGRNPCGSSSGSGVAVAANLCAFAIGTETNGSIACPASINGIVGLKPTVGLVSRGGIIPISETQDTAGPMTRTVYDAALVLAAISASDPNDPITLQRPATMPSDYTRFLEEGQLRNKRIGVEKSFLKVHEEVDVLLQKALDQLRKKGATIVEVELVEKLREIDDSEYNVLLYEFKDGLNRYLSGAKAGVKSLKDVIEFNRMHADRTMPYFAQEILESSEKKGTLDTKEYLDALDKILTVSRKAIDGLMKAHGLVSICGPATGPTWCTDLVNGDSFSGYGLASGPAIAGYPSISVPLGQVHGLPTGILFIGRPYKEHELLSIAYAYEQASANRSAPDFRKEITM